mgnify:CR=1 FL=1
MKFYLCRGNPRGQGGIIRTDRAPDRAARLLAARGARALASVLYGDYPCHRVVNHAGALAASFAAQRELLEAEGVEFRGERARMKKHRWEC